MFLFVFVLLLCISSACCNGMAGIVAGFMPWVVSANVPWMWWWCAPDVVVLCPGCCWCFALVVLLHPEMYCALGGGVPCLVMAF